ncbi:diguanylate cyclase [Wenzhouxiangella sp. AB-CW3]|uniref:GGDEF domain-containing protein n=1 Tax=Wenzhouxiangella sp. AB-CW3 TaxID=2771012 RepID=UPI00168BF311|nr:diguanylate cyclase [Wenzhouxiangella sp. AB-CW3]QOC23832.1 diguanylate cyclase [Wenzhouxiangella sp. AB-CW3]
MQAATDQRRIDAHQALRLRRLRMAMLAWLVSIVVVFIGWSLGLIDFTPLGFSALLLLILMVHLMFHVLIRSGWNLRLEDPSMTLPQIIVATLVALVVISRADEARTILLMLFIMAMFFGVFQLRTPQFVFVALVAVVGYALIVLGEFVLGDYQRSGQVMLLELAAFSIVMFWLAFVGSHVARLRRKLAQRNRELREATDRLKHLAEHDELTGLPNRRRLISQLETLARESAETGSTFCVAVLDLDHFKHVNDEHGHQVGDDVLTEFARRGSQLLRDGDQVVRVDDTVDSIGRFGGEEFLLILPGTDLEGAVLAAERLRRQTADEPFETRNKRISCTVSIGVAQYRAEEPVRLTIARADKALYRAKEEGRNRTVAAEA